MEPIWHKTTGRIIYDPPRGNMKTRVDWWCVIDAHNDIARYARYWVDKQRNPLGFDGKNLCNPAWGAHVSVVRGERPAPELRYLWKKYHGQIIDFEYSFDVYQTGQDPTKPRPDHFWCIPVRCPLAVQIRRELDLYTSYNLHMTIGRVY